MHEHADSSAARAARCRLAPPDAGSCREGSHDFVVAAKSLPRGAYVVVPAMGRRAFTLPLAVQ
ncbi:MAG TPA: hypothetical protein VHI13_09890 [Candidatus Kapabacteria bacterium]|nr:hypothetical protein [Candidatus Kapabacteria bacterium]